MESRDDFEKLHADLRAEFSPCGRAEEEAVLDLAVAHWNKQTVWRMRQCAVLKDPFTSDIVQTGRKSWSGIRKELRAKARSEESLPRLAEEIFADLRSEVERVQRKIEQTSDREEIAKLENKMGACMRLLTEYGGPFLVLMTKVPTAENAFDNAYAPECMEKFVRLEALIDGRITKILARLVGLKEFKRTPAGSAVTPLEVTPRQLSSRISP